MYISFWRYYWKFAVDVLSLLSCAVVLNHAYNFFHLTSGHHLFTTSVLPFCDQDKILKFCFSLINSEQEVIRRVQIYIFSSSFWMHCSNSNASSYEKISTGNQAISSTVLPEPRIFTLLQYIMKIFIPMVSPMLGTVAKVLGYRSYLHVANLSARNYNLTELLC